MKAASLSYVGESMANFQIEVAELRNRLKDADAEIARMRGQIEGHENQKADLESSSEQAKFMAKESHNQNLDILKHMDRMEKLLELARKQEKEAQGQMNQLQQTCKEKNARIKTVEEQLEEARAKITTMVPKEDLEASKDECRSLEHKIEELDEKLQTKHRDYLAIVEAYGKITGQQVGAEPSGLDARPLTPRPDWYHCRGLVDPHYHRTVDKAENSQEILQHMLVCSRTLLSAYGLYVAGNKSSMFREYTKHPLTLPVAIADEESKILNRTQDGIFGSDDDLDGSPPESKREPAKSLQMAQESEDELLPPDIDPETPQVFKHSAKMKNLKFSRRKVSDFMENLMQLRHKHKLTTDVQPFSECLLGNVPDDVPDEEKKLWAINMFAALRRYAAEPDYLAYYLLVLGKISDVVVRDNKRLCAELLKIFVNHFESSDGSHNITKQKFFYGLREVLPNKEKEMWQDLVTYFPAGGADLLVNYEWLLFDDLYVLSPIVYALRIQHLEESLQLTERLEKLVMSVANEKLGWVEYGALQEEFMDHPEFSVFQEEDMAHAFESNVTQLTPDTTQDTDKCLAILKQGDVFHILFFPALAGDDPELAAQDDMP
jgi:hypothetical protein